MNFLIIGLGNFGSSLAIRLTELGHEVIGVDSNMGKVEAFKNSITHTICAKCTDMQSAREVPVKDADVVVVSIGEDEGNSIMVTANMKQLNAKRIISRAVSETQEVVLRAMGIDEIVHPEQDSAEKLARTLTTEGFIDSFELSEEYSIVKVNVPERYEEKSLIETDIRSKYNINVLATISKATKKKFLGRKHAFYEVKGIAKADTILGKDEILVIFGNVKDIERFLE